MCQLDRQEGVWVNTHCVFTLGVTVRPYDKLFHTPGPVPTSPPPQALIYFQHLDTSFLSSVSFLVT